MPDTLKITLAQMNQSVGDLAGNAMFMWLMKKKKADLNTPAYPYGGLPKGW